MDSLIVFLREIKKALGFQGTLEELKRSPELIEYCLQHHRIPKLVPSDLTKEGKDRLTDFLTDVTKDYLKANPDIHSWSDLTQKPDARKIHKLLFEFGVREEVFPFDLTDEEEVPPSRTSLTLPEFYELCQIQFHYNGSFHSFKRFIQTRYGSFAEYCISKGFDINSTRWENDETAIRVARKLGSIEVVKTKSKSLFKYLEERNLLEEIFGAGLSRVSS